MKKFVPAMIIYGAILFTVGFGIWMGYKDQKNQRCDVLEVVELGHCAGAGFLSRPQCRVKYSNGLTKTTDPRLLGETEKVCWDIRRWQPE